MDQQETKKDHGDDDQNQDDDVDDIDESEEDVEIDAHNELDESGRDDDDDMDGDDDINSNEKIADDDDAQDATMITEELVVSSLEQDDKRRIGPAASRKPHPRKGMKGPRGGGTRRRNSNGISSRTPSVRGLTIPFRTIKKSMKLDPDIPIVQNEAAIMATVAVELFLKRLVTQSHRNAKNRGRKTVRYEDVAEARTNDKALAFLEILLP